MNMNNIDPLTSLKSMGTIKKSKISKNLSMPKNFRTMQSTLGVNMNDTVNTTTETKPSLGVIQIPRKKQFYKTKMCPWFFSGKCDRKEDCLFAHSEEELNPIPDLSFTSLCPSTKKTGFCNNENCSYAHSVNELRPTGDLYKTAPCTKFMRGKCAAGEHCRHAHFIEELRPLPGDITPSENAVSLMLSPVFAKMINQNENRKKGVNYARNNNVINKHKNNIDTENIFKEEKKDLPLKQAKTTIGNITSANQKNKSKKYLKDIDEEHISFNNNNNYQKSYSIPVQYIPVLFKNYKNSNANVNNNINDNQGEETLTSFPKMTKPLLNAQMRNNTNGVKNFMTSKDFNNFHITKGINKNENNNTEGENNKMIKNANIKKIVNILKNNTYDRNLAVEQNVKKFVNEMLKSTREEKNRNYVNKEKNIEHLNKHPSFNTREISIPKRMSSIPSLNKEEFSSNFEDNNNIQDAINQVEMTIQENAFKPVDESEKVDPENINALLSLLQMQNKNNFDQSNFLINEKGNQEENVDYEGTNENDIRQMGSYDSLSFLQHKKQPNTVKGKRLNFQMNMPERSGSKYIQQTTKNKKKTNKTSNNFNNNNNNNKQDDHVNALQFSNNPLASCSNFWNFGDDDAAAAAQNMAQLLKVKIIDY